MYSEPNESEAATTWDTEVGTGLTATLDGGVLTISGDGAMDNYQSGEAPWDSDRASIISVVIEQGVTSIGDNAFGYCNNLKTVTIQGDVETIGRYAFECCSSLEIVTIQGDVETIGDSAFYECTSLTSVDIPDSVKTIGDSALSRSGLISITIPDKVTTLGDYAFYECTSLESVYMLGSIGTIGSGTFGYCSSLESVDIPDSVKTIGDYAFDACTSLTAIVIHDSVTIGDYAFRGCKSLETVTVTGGLGSDGKIVTDGVIDTYFKEGKSWTLRGAPIAVTSLTLEGISCREYNPDNLDRKGGIEAADDGRELNYEYDRFTWDSVTSSWGTARSVSGNLIINGGTASEENVTVSLGSSGWYTALTDSDGYYIIENVPKGISDYVTAEIAGYTQKNQELVTLDVNKTGQDLTLEINKYSVTLTKGTGSGGFTYKVSNESAIPYAVPFLVTHGDTLVIAALFSEEYAFDSWSGYSDSKINPLTLSDISGPVTLTASGELIE
ncbi:MAG: leucine-rich repeat protein, partial [Candidatus Methanoplasma sp.]|nr:leucine-rich repeat protein [Candidatus Methanoplasma sp.]